MHDHSIVTNTLPMAPPQQIRNKGGEMLSCAAASTSHLES
jgi:hypothetical protein